MNDTKVYLLDCGTMVLDQSLTGYGIKKREDGNYQVSENLLRLLQTGLYS